MNYKTTIAGLILVAVTIGGGTAIAQQGNNTQVDTTEVSQTSGNNSNALSEEQTIEEIPTPSPITTTSLSIQGITRSELDAELAKLRAEIQALTLNSSNTSLPTIINNTRYIDRITQTRQSDSIMDSVSNSVNNSTSVGALATGSITSGFGAIDIGSSALSSGTLSTGTISTTGFVGVGTTTVVSTNEKLSVAGDAMFAGGIYLGSFGYVGPLATGYLGTNLKDANGTPTQIDSSLETWFTRYGSGANTNSSWVIGYMGPGKTWGQQKNFLWINKTGVMGVGTGYSPTASSYQFGLYGASQSDSTGKTTAFDAMYITNVATSTTNSIVKSGIKISSTGSWTGTGASNIGLYVSSVTGGTNNYDAIFNGGGNVGIGTTTPSEKLQVLGNIAPSTDDTYDLGTATYRWDDVFATNGTVQTSDARLKENVNNMSYGLDTINALRPVDYTWISNPEKGVQLGLIAQEVFEIVPEAVNIGDDANKTLGLRYTNFIPILINAVKELSLKIDELQKQISEGLVYGTDVVFNRITANYIKSNQIDAEKICLDGICIDRGQLEGLLLNSGVTVHYNENISEPSVDESEDNVSDTVEDISTENDTSTTTDVIIDDNEDEVSEEVITEDEVSEDTEESEIADIDESQVDISVE